MNHLNYCVTKYKNGVLGCGFEDGAICDIAYDSSNNPTIGSIYVAKVTEIVSNIESAFISYAPGKKGYLSLKNLENTIVLNRPFDGKLKAGDEILVSYETEPIRTKDPVFTTNLSLSGKYCVVSNGNRTKTISSKIDRSKKDIFMQYIPKDISFGVIVRTNATELLGNNLEALTNEIKILGDKLSTIITEGIHRTLYSVIYEAPGAYLNGIRDNGFIYDQIVTDDQYLYDNIKNYLDLFMPEAKEKLSLYSNESISLSNVYGINTKIDELLDKKVWLKSGAYLIIEQTEAMYVIDVNSGKNIAKKANADYIYAINMEAAKEIMRQIRLRNISGMILVDFINMSSKEHEDKLFRELSALAKKDSVKTIIVDYTKLGLLEITRKKVKKSLNCQLNT